MNIYIINLKKDLVRRNKMESLIEKYNLIPVVKDEVETIQFGSTCKHIILSQGTFSYFIGILAFYSDIYYSNNGIDMWHGDIFVFPDWHNVNYMIEKS